MVGTAFQVAPVPPELKEWGVNTSLAVLVGIVLFGGRQIVRNRQSPGDDHQFAKEANLVAVGVAGQQAAFLLAFQTLSVAQQSSP